MNAPARAGLLCASLVAAAAAVRVVACADAFWLDEIWSWYLAREMTSALDAFTRIHHSNNHHLNTLWLYAIGERDHWVLVRLPSLLAGTGSVALAAALAWRRSPLDATCVTLLLGASYAMIHFSSEARGYAGVVFFSLAALWALTRTLEHPRSRLDLAFGTFVVLGCLSHLTFLGFYAGAIAQSVWKTRGSGRLAQLTRLHALPLIALVALVWVDLSRLVLGGGIPTDPALVVARTIGFALGLPPRAQLALPYAALVLVILVAALWRMGREGRDTWLLLAISIAVAPVAVFWWLDPQILAVRYFVIPIALFLLAAGSLLADGLRAGGPARVAGIAALAVFLVGNAVHTAAFLRHGRGGYAEALQFMAEHTETPAIAVSSNHDLRNGMTLRFYARRLPPGRRLEYFERERRPEGGTPWMLRDLPERPALTPPFLVDVAGHRFTLAADFEHAGLSGFYWSVYRREAPED